LAIEQEPGVVGCQAMEGADSVKAIATESNRLNLVDPGPHSGKAVVSGLLCLIEHPVLGRIGPQGAEMRKQLSNLDVFSNVHPEGAPTNKHRRGEVLFSNLHPR
jgi:hypothetical protein